MGTTAEVPMLAQGYMTTIDACQGVKLRRMSRSRTASGLQINSARRAAVDGDAHAGDERGARRYEEAHEIGDVLGGPDPPAPLRLHDREDRPRHPDVAENLQAPVARPLLVGDLHEVAAPDGARVVHKNVEAAEALPHRRGDAIDLVEPAQIAGHDEDLGVRSGLDLP